MSAALHLSCLSSLSSLPPPWQWLMTLSCRVPPRWHSHLSFSSSLRSQETRIKVGESGQQKKKKRLMPHVVSGGEKGWKIPLTLVNMLDYSYKAFIPTGRLDSCVRAVLRPCEDQQVGLITASLLILCVAQYQETSGGERKEEVNISSSLSSLSEDCQAYKNVQGGWQSWDKSKWYKRVFAVNCVTLLLIAAKLAGLLTEF